MMSIQRSIFLVVFFIYQNMRLVQSLQNDYSKLKEMQNYIEKTLENVEELTTQTTRAMYGLSSWYVEEGLEEVNRLLSISSSDALITAHETLFNEVNKCIDDVDTNIHTTIKEFVEIEEKAKSFLDAINEIRRESVNSEIDDSIDHLRHRYQSTVDPYVTEYLTQLKHNSVSLPLKVKKCVESLTMIVPLFFKAETQFSEMMSDLERLWLSFADEKRKLSTKIDVECSSHILEGLEKVKQLSSQREQSYQITTKIIECRNKGIDFLKGVDTKFTEILDEARTIVDNSKKHIQIQGPTLDDMSDQHDDFMKDFEGQLDSTTNAAIEAFLKELRQDSILVPKRVKKCVDDAIYLLWVSSIKLEL